MKTLGAGYLAQAGAADQAPVWLAELAGWGGATVRWAASDGAVTYGGQAYAARPFEAGAPTASLDGGPQRLTLAVANQDLAVSILCAAADPRGARLTLRRVFLDDLSAAQTLAAGLVVTAYRVGEAAVAFDAVALADLLRRQLPRRTFDRICPYEFKGPWCAYAGTAAYCSADRPATGPHEYTDAACRALGNFLNFGGVLFAPEER